MIDWRRWWIVLLLAWGCQTSVTPQAQVELVSWQTRSPTWSVGTVQNLGDRQAVNVQVTTRSWDKRQEVVSPTNPPDLDPGRQGTFVGAGSGQGEVREPELVGITWEEGERE